MAEDEIHDIVEDDTPLRCTGQTEEVTADAHLLSNTLQLMGTMPQFDVLRTLLAIVERQAQIERERREAE